MNYKIMFFSSVPGNRSHAMPEKRPGVRSRAAGENEGFSRLGLRVKVDGLAMIGH